MTMFTKSVGNIVSGEGKGNLLIDNPVGGWYSKKLLSRIPGSFLALWIECVGEGAFQPPVRR